MATIWFDGLGFAVEESGDGVSALAKIQKALPPNGETVTLKVHTTPVPGGPKVTGHLVVGPRQTLFVAD